jgi:hypothetical protein
LGLQVLILIFGHSKTGPSHHPAATAIFVQLGFIAMPGEPHTATEIARMIKERAVVELGPWPIDLQLFIFGTSSGWTCGLSPATQAGDAQYRGGVLVIARELQLTISLIRTENPPAL